MSVMSVLDIGRLGKMLGQFLSRFGDCFARAAGQSLLRVYVRVYVRGLLSAVPRKNVEAIALDQKVAPRTLQRLLESIAWSEEKLRDRCQQIVAAEHPHR